MPPKNPQRRQNPKHKKCEFCEKETKSIDWKDYPIMKPFIDYFGNIRNRYYTGMCLKHQKLLKTAVERARFMGVLSYRK